MRQDNPHLKPLQESTTKFFENLEIEITKAEAGKCPHCKGFGSDGQPGATLCKCIKAPMWNAKFAECGIPARYFGKSLEENWNLKQDAWGRDLSERAKVQKKAVMRVAVQYSKALPAICSGLPLKITPLHGGTVDVSNLLLVGGTFSGKSLIAAVIAQEAVKKSLTLRFYDYTDLYADLSGFENKAKQEEAAEVFKTKDLIILDGVTSYDMRNPVLGIQLDRLARARINSNKPILITAYRGYDKIDAGPGWKSLLASSYLLGLPTASAPSPYDV